MFPHNVMLGAIVGKWLDEFLTKNGDTVADVEARLKIGSGTLQEWRQGIHGIPVSHIPALCRLLWEQLGPLLIELKTREIQDLSFLGFMAPLSIEQRQCLLLETEKDEAGLRNIAQHMFNITHETGNNSLERPHEEYADELAFFGRHAELILSAVRLITSVDTEKHEALFKLFEGVVAFVKTDDRVQETVGS